MATAKSVIDQLITKGVLPCEYREFAVLELDRELIRRARRISQTLAAMTAMQQFAIHFAEIES